MFLRRRVPESGPLKAAVIGAGAFGRHHAAKYAAMDDVVLFAVADPSAESRAVISSKYDDVLTVADWAGALAKG